MTQLIRDVCRTCFPRANCRFAAMARRPLFFFIFVLLLIAVSCVAVATPPQQSQDPSAKPAFVPVSAAVFNSRLESFSSYLNRADFSAERPFIKKKVITEDGPGEAGKSHLLERSRRRRKQSYVAIFPAKRSFGHRRWVSDPNAEAEFRNQFDALLGNEIWRRTECGVRLCKMRCRRAERLLRHQATDRRRSSAKGVVSEYIRNDVHSRLCRARRAS